ncbi:GNAT family N-acetyltransferase [Microbulbifer hydrolyticus]|uniref:GNAT family N-acetyltransferase n=1 Tax=Microbulbifer hydrolyticus TaxID=48074 RepID=A0A6P1TFR3_9GAMM|nr:GNAT family N-acetyltransferase [Microbulbifer hydrolyticus]MBB5211914.1 RimJ/RimL family protein N-acetyltransferase [Microbulbifer hydrolyticus]QHQ40503.1 GNAT family N-acetyltransferase [Microbulbifer hydrolyticus]
MTDRIEPKTARLQLRQWQDADREPFAQMNADSRVMEFFPATLTRAESDAGIDRQIRHIEKYGWGFWAIERLEDRKFIGFVGIKHVADDMPFAPAVEIGWRLAADAWGRGYASEAARASLQVAFEQLGLADVVSFTVPANVRSRAVMEKLGMMQEQNFLHPALPPGHPMQEHVLYRLDARGYTMPKRA